MRAVDLFAGFGGFTEGAEQAGVRVVFAANHWRLAVEAHARNHPSTEHSCQDLRQMDWTSLPDYDLLLAGPACQGHSTASQPKRRQYHDSMRATAWAVVDCVEVTQPRALIVENVPAFGRWQLFHLWWAALGQLGYRLEQMHLTASNHGVPQRRKRLFIVGTRTGAKITLNQEGKEEPAFGPCVDWDAGHWRSVSKAGRAVQGRIARAQRVHGPRCLTQHVTGHPGVSLDEPIRTITTKDQWAVVDGRYYRPLTIRENARAMGFPEHYEWPAESTRTDAIRGLGNAVCPPVARDLIREVERRAA